MLRDAYRPGLQALREIHRQAITAVPRNLKGSVNIDETLSETLPNEPRWDYGVGYIGEDGEKVFWVEFHPASIGEINSVLRKLEWLKGWTRANAPDLSAMRREFIWIASGASGFGRGTPQVKRLANAGIRFVGGHLTLN